MNSFFVRENYTYVDTDSGCLCNNERERPTLDETPQIVRDGHKNHYYRHVRIINSHLSGLTIFETTDHHVIPLSLIRRFFKIWLGDQTSLIPGEFNNCVYTLFGRLKRSMLKILIVAMKKSRQFIDAPVYNVSLGEQYDLNDAFFTNVFGNARSWLSGNIFIGPSNRGPFNPGRAEEQMEENFDYDAESLIDPRHYEDLLVLFQKLVDYLNRAHDMNSFERLMNGFNNFISITIILGGYDVTYFDFDQSEEKEQEFDELKEFRSDQNLRRNKFWAIKKNFNRRSKRSIENKSKNIWSEFILDVVKIAVKAREQGKHRLGSATLIVC